MYLNSRRIYIKVTTVNKTICLKYCQRNNDITGRLSSYVHCIMNFKISTIIFQCKI